MDHCRVIIVEIEFFLSYINDYGNLYYIGKKNYSSEYAKLAGKFLLSGEIFQLYSIIFLFSPTHFLAASKTSFAMS